VLGLVEALDGEENASEVVGVDWDHEPWTRQACPEPRTKAFRPSVALIEGARQLWRGLKPMQSGWRSCADRVACSHAGAD
jgi:hypothetical protein